LDWAQSLTTEQWLMGLASALFVGFSKSGIPGAGILVVPLMAHAFGARLSIGTTLVLLLMGDVFAVYWYRRHARLEHIWKLVPWVLVGMAAGGFALLVLGNDRGGDLLNPLIGLMVLLMIGLSLARKKLGDRFAPHSMTGVKLTGIGAGFSTTVANAGGPVMAIYLQGTGLLKQEMIGTSGWYFFVFNLAKVPLYIALTFALPNDPVWNKASLAWTIAAFPAVALGAQLGRWSLPKIDQRAFDSVVMILAAIAAIRLLLA
jgi:uncharacterized membrane protein YfcA